MADGDAPGRAPREELRLGLGVVEMVAGAVHEMVLRGAPPGVVARVQPYEAGDVGERADLAVHDAIPAGAVGVSPIVESLTTRSRRISTWLPRRESVTREVGSSRGARRAWALDGPS
ncbi:MAG TPA: hypothetical protein VJ994_13885, partial [Paracoccaceae bacterium]|nr:hypothetical protein [Paracoccaceae bacterium]